MKHHKRLAGFAIIAFAMVFALAAFVSSIMLPPVVSISAIPNPTQTTSTIIAVASDLSHAGIERLEIYENGIKVKECSISSCVYNAVHVVAGNWRYQAYAVDKYGRTGSSSVIFVSFSGNASFNHAPVLDYTGNKTINAGNLLQFSINASDADGDALTYNASGLPAGASFDANTRTFSWTPDVGNIGTYHVVFSVSDGLASDFEIVRIDVVSAVDSDAPDWDNLVENPSTDSEYAPGQNYEFNITWNDNVGVAEVWIVFDGVNYSITGDSNNVYSFNISDLAAGNHSYAWYAIDASGNMNTTGLINYAIAKAIPQLSIIISPSSSVVNGTITNVTGIGCPIGLTCNLYRGNVLVSNPDIAALNVGTYTYVFNATGNENYTDASVLRTLIVSKSSGAVYDYGDNGTGDICLVNNADLMNGYYIYLDINDKIKFMFCSAPYYIKLSDIGYKDERAYFVLNPGSEAFALDEGEKEEFDLNGNGAKDLIFKLESVTNSHRVKVYIKGLPDKCENHVKLLNLTNYESQGVDYLGTKKRDSLLVYVVYLLMAGIFLAALAIVIYLLSRVKRRR